MSFFAVSQTRYIAVVGTAVLLLLGLSLTLTSRSLNYGYSAPGIQSAIKANNSIPGSTFPQKIWQTGPPAERLDPNLVALMHTWEKLNPEHEYTFLDDDAALAYVSDRFSEYHPELVALYNDLDDVILRADLLRLLCMWADGGVYSDIDTECLVPIDRWLPSPYVETASLVIGIVADLPENPVENRRSEIVQWTFLSKPAAKYTVKLVEEVVSNLRKYAEEKNASIGEIGKIMSVGDVMRITGPIGVTWALYDALRYHLRAPFEWYNVTGLREPKLVDDVLFLPINAFGSNQQHSHSGEVGYGPIFLKHHFSGSWHNNKNG
ncbi:hypothetical protein BGW36DRAFT_433242 [Talaromyces proteolyticus]|uniref:Initiation-specific alpha-1,6-mannosyltransferase n=1 Tax=Talaromyces proteolyticus TaxID=1131652 RepID=A0AAD4KG70_9EURO|nr:uncharacterized protein BGW36DRAFT_433242 [Talaromyces proteolyticus]KAH8690291.1 hypothetical protein BGW36DRAFT_433242 [Talaromyces proteolyticus]